MEQLWRHRGKVSLLLIVTFIMIMMPGSIIPVKATNNLVQNPEFDNGTQHWSLGNSGGASSAFAAVTGAGLSGTNALKVSISNGGTAVWNVQVTQQVSIEAGKTYTIRFRAKADTQKNIQVMLQQWSSPYTVYWVQDVTVGTSPDTYGEYTFTSNVTDPTARLVFNLGGNTTDIYLDEIIVSDNGIDGPEPTNNLVKNPEFDNGTQHWSLGYSNGASATFAAVSGAGLSGANALKVSISNGGSAAWNVQVTQQVSIESGKTYTIRFRAKADAQKNIEVMLQKWSSPYTAYWVQNVSVGTSPNTYGEYTFTSNVTDPTARLVFNLGGNTTDIYLDEIIVSDNGINDPEPTPSPTPTPTPTPTPPAAVNLVQNPEFDNGTQHWSLGYSNGASATFAAVSGAGLSGANALKVSISNGGSAAWNVQVTQQVSIESGKTYTIRFRAKADAQKNIQVMLQKWSSPYTAYWVQDVTVGTTPNTYGEYTFTSGVTDPTARLVFNLGGNTTDIYLDEIIVSTTDGIPPTPTPTPGTGWYTQGNRIYKDGVQMELRGTNIMSVFGLNYDEIDAWGMDITRECIDMKMTTNAQLQQIVNHARSKGFVVILAGFWYDHKDLGGNTPYPNCQLLGANPQQDPRYRAIMDRWKEIALLFKDQSDVWFNPWNEPYMWDGSNGYTDDMWEVDARAMIEEIRSTGATNPIVLNPSHMGQGHEVLINRGPNILRDYDNIIFSVHAYNHKWNIPQSEIEARFQSMLDAGLPFIVEEFANNGDEIWNPIMNACRNKKITLLAWLWNQYKEPFRTAYRNYCLEPR